MNSKTSVDEYREQCERYVLSISVLDPAQIPTITSLVNPSDFVDPVIQKIFSLVRMMNLANEPVTTETVLLSIMKSDLLHELGGSGEYAKLIQESPAVCHADYYAREVARLALMRKLQREAQKLIDNVNSKDSDPMNALSQFTTITKDAGYTFEKKSFHFGEIIKQLYDAGDSDERCHTGTRLPTGYPKLDQLIGGYFTGNLVLLGGRFGKGKSGMSAEQVAYLASRNHAAKVFSLEMTKEEYLQRVVSSIEGISMNAWTRRRTVEEQTKIRGLLTAQEKYRWSIDDSSRQTVSSIRSSCQLAKAREGLDLVVIDNLQLLEAEQKHLKRDQQVKDITEELKRIAKDLDVVILLLCQLDTLAAKQRPDSTSWATSKAIEGDADVAIILHQDEASGRYEVIVTKNRSRGERGSLDFTFDGEFQRFSDGAYENL